MIEEKAEARDDLLAGRYVFRESHPSAWPLVEVFAEGQPIERVDGLRRWRRLRYGTRFRLPRADRHGTDDDSKPVLSRSRICLRRGTLHDGQAADRGARAAQGRFRSDLLGVPAAPAGVRSSGRTAVRVHSRVGFSGLFSVSHAARELPALRRGGRGRPVGEREASIDEGVYAVSRALGPQAVLEGGRGVVSDVLGEGLRLGRVRGAVGAGASNAGTHLRDWRG